MQKMTPDLRRLEMRGCLDETIGAIGMGQTGFGRLHPIGLFVDFQGNPTLVCRFAIVMDKTAGLTDSNHVLGISSHECLRRRKDTQPLFISLLGIPLALGEISPSRHLRSC